MATADPRVMPTLADVIPLSWLKLRWRQGQVGDRVSVKRSTKSLTSAAGRADRNHVPGKRGER